MVAVTSMLKDGPYCTISIIFMSRKICMADSLMVNSYTYGMYGKQVLLCYAQAQNWHRSNYTLLVFKSRSYKQHIQIDLKTFPKQVYLFCSRELFLVQIKQQSEMC